MGDIAWYDAHFKEGEALREQGGKSACGRESWSGGDGIASGDTLNSLP